MELLILTRLAIACVTAVFGNAFSKWFLNTKVGGWFQRKVNKLMEFLANRYDIEIAKKEANLPKTRSVASIMYHFICTVFLFTQVVNIFFTN